mgnify:FL=1
MFPFDIEEDEQDEELEEESIPVEYEIDFSTGQLTGRKVEGVDAIKIWIWNALATPRYRYEHHTWNFGHELENLIGQTNDIDYIKAIAESMIRECLTVNPYITDIEDVDIKADSDTLICKFSVLTEFGEIEGVEVNV